MGKGLHVSRLDDVLHDGAGGPGHGGLHHAPEVTQRFDVPHDGLSVLFVQGAEGLQDVDIEAGFGFAVRMIHVVKLIANLFRRIPASATFISLTQMAIVSILMVYSDPEMGKGPVGQWGVVLEIFTMGDGGGIKIF